MVILAAVFMAAATFLPDNAYQRHQLMDGTIYGGGRVYYERMTFDPRPIDVAIFGNSRAAVGLKPARIEQALAAAGTPANVENFSLVGDGRNIHWAFVRELLKTKRPKVIVLAINEHAHPWGHDSFRYFAPASEVRREAALGLHDAKKNLVYLPFRQIMLFGAMLAPDLFGMPTRYTPLPLAPEQDLTQGHMTDDGRYVSADQQTPREVLLQQRAENIGKFNRHSRLPKAVRDVTDADDRVYTDLIARAARARGVKIVFVYLPAFSTPDPIDNRAAYEALGPLQDDADLTERDDLYVDWSHLNAAGTAIASDRLAGLLSGMLPKGATAAAP